VGSSLQWGELLFPLHGRWYTALQMNAPSNPVQEFSIREYGRFGFFFKREIKRQETLTVHYRFLVRNSDPPAQSPNRSPDQIRRARAAADAAYAAFAGERR